MALPHDRLDELDPNDIAAEYQRHRLADLSDEALLDRVYATIAVPRVEQADSFVLHAPLEVIARARLLRGVDPAVRDAARLRLVWIAATLAAWGTPVSVPSATGDDPAELAGRLVDAIAHGEQTDAASLAGRLGSIADVPTLRRLVAPAVTASLAAAGHASIFFHLLPRVAATSNAAPWMLATTAHELARFPELALSWQTDEILDQPATRSLAEALADVERVGSPGSNFIYPLMSQAEDKGIAQQTLSDAVGPNTDVDTAANDLARIAAWSMLRDDPDQSPYGWSHALTMPQAVASVARVHPRPQEALAIAGTHLVGFRTGSGTVDIAPEPLPAPTTDAATVTVALDEGFAAASDAALRIRADQEPALVQTLVSNAATHHDAHLAKYVNACLDAQRADPTQGRLYLAAAAHLTAWWRQIPQPDDDPIG